MSRAGTMAQLYSWMRPSKPWKSGRARSIDAWMTSEPAKSWHEDNTRPERDLVPLLPLPYLQCNGNHVPHTVVRRCTEQGSRESCISDDARTMSKSNWSSALRCGRRHKSRLIFSNAIRHHIAPDPEALLFDGSLFSFLHSRNLICTHLRAAVSPGFRSSSAQNRRICKSFRRS